MNFPINTLRKSIYLLFCGLFFACSEPKATYSDINQTSKEKNSIIIKVNESIPFSWPDGLQIENVTFLESQPEYLISFLRKLIVSPDGEDFYILDAVGQKILLFDKSGKAKKIFSYQGEGPEEYLEMTDAQINFDKETIEIMDYQRIKKYNLNTFKYIGTEDLSKLPKDKNFRNFVRINDVLYLWSNLPPNQQVSERELSSHHLVRLENKEVDYYVDKKAGVISGQIFYPSSTKGEYNLPPVVGSTDIIAVNEDSVYTKYKLDYGNRGIPKFELDHFWERQDEIFKSNYYKPPQNIRETKDYLYFEFAGNMVAYFVLVNRNTNTIESIGRAAKRLDPPIIFSDANYFYAYLMPGFIVNYVKEGGDLSETTFFKDLDISKIDKSDNPIIIKFKLPTPK